MRSHGFFTLGGALALVWRPAYPLLPWALTSALLMTAGLWDFWPRGGRVEWIVMGLAAYEFMIGLMEEDDRPAVSVTASDSSPSSAHIVRVES
jgi:hypothetical protein